MAMFLCVPGLTEEMCFRSRGSAVYTEITSYHSTIKMNYRKKQQVWSCLLVSYLIVRRNVVSIVKILIIKKFSLKWFYTWVQGQFFANISHLNFYIPGNINFGKVLGEIIDNVYESGLEASWIQHHAYSNYRKHPRLPRGCTNTRSRGILVVQRLGIESHQKPYYCLHSMLLLVLIAA